MVWKAASVHDLSLYDEEPHQPDQWSVLSTPADNSARAGISAEHHRQLDLCSCEGSKTP